MTVRPLPALPPADREYLTTVELADALGVTPRTITRRVQAGRLRPVIKMPGLRGGFLFEPPVGVSAPARRPAEVIPGQTAIEVAS